MNCLPQFGLGKAEFSITANKSGTADFPADFKDLSDPSVTVTTKIEDKSNLDSYFSTVTPVSGPSTVTKNMDSSTATKQNYTTDVPYRISSTAAIDPTTLPAACHPTEVSYATAWKVTYLPTTVTYSQKIKGKTWKYTLTSAPKSLYLGLPLDKTNGYVPVTGATDPICAADGNLAIYSASTDLGDESAFDALIIAFFDHATRNDQPTGAITSTLSPFPTFDATSQNQPSVGDLGVLAPKISDPSATTTAALALTGVDATSGLVAAGGFLAGGAALFGFAAFARRRRSRRA